MLAKHIDSITGDSKKVGYVPLQITSETNLWQVTVYISKIKYIVTIEICKYTTFFNET